MAGIPLSEDKRIRVEPYQEGKDGSDIGCYVLAIQDDGTPYVARLPNTTSAHAYQIAKEYLEMTRNRSRDVPPPRRP